MTQEKNSLQVHTSRTLAVGAVLLVVLLVVRAIRTRSLEDFLTYPLYIAAGLTTGTVAFFLVRNLILRQGLRLSRKSMTELFSALAGNCLLAVIYYSCYVGLADLAVWLRQSAEDDLSIILFLALALAFLLFLFRLRLRVLYGLTEALAGFIVISHRILTSDSSVRNQDAGFYLAILTAGLYLIVRGMDNIHQGLTKPPLDLVARFIVRAFEPEDGHPKIEVEQQKSNAG